MNFDLSDEQALLVSSTRRFARDTLIELAVQMEQEDAPLPDHILKSYAEQGFLGLPISSEFGGHDSSHLDAVLMLEQLAQVSTAVSFPVFDSCFGPVRSIERLGSPELRRAVIPRVCRGELVVAVAMSEPEAGTALTDLKTRGLIERDEVVINGNKRWSSGASHAGGYVVYCRMNDAPGARGVGAVYVSTATPGLSFGKRERLMGFRGVPSADIYLEDVRVPVSNIIAQAGEFSKLFGTFNIERLGNSTMALGQASAALEDTLAYLQERRQFGKAIIDFQANQLKLADMAIAVEAARLMVLRAAVKVDSGEEASLEVSMAKCFTNQIAREVCGNAIQLMGAYGYSRAYTAERRFRDSWGWGIAGGTIDIQKTNIAASLVGRRFDQRR